MRAQGSLEYLVIITAAIAVLAVVASFVVGYFSTQSGQFYYASCSNAAALCRDTLLINSDSECAMCNNACNLSDGTEIFASASSCCRLGLPSEIYSGSDGSNCVSCSDRTLYDKCSASLPLYCNHEGTLVSNCTGCGCPYGQTCNHATGSCYVPIPSCDADGTPINQCSIANKGKNCSTDAALFDDCVHCGCPTGSSCNATTNACYLSCDPDPTPRGQCKTTKPDYCNMLGGIVSNCTKCDCPIGKSCNALNQQCGTCPYSSSASLIMSTFPRSVAIGDVDGIPGNELVVSSYQVAPNPGELRLYRYDGGSWSNETIGTLTNGIEVMAIGDVDKDGVNEIVVANFSDVSMYKKVGAVWQRTLIKTGLPTFVQSITVGDADNDGQGEVVVGLAWLSNDYGLKLYKYNAGSWTETNISKLSAHVLSVAVGDADNNHLNEIVIGTECCITNEIRLYRYTGTWQEEPIADLSNNVETITIGDADNDKLNEVVAGGRWADYRIRMYKNVSSIWTMVQIADIWGLVYSTSVGDADNDGFNEVLAGQDASGNLALFKNKPSGWSTTVLDDPPNDVLSVAIGNADNLPGNEVVSTFGAMGSSYGVKVYSCNWVY